MEVMDLPSGLKRIVIDCRHGTTEGLARDAGGIGDAAIVAGVLLKHFAEEGCDCTHELRQQYPPTLLPRTLWILVEANCP